MSVIPTSAATWCAADLELGEGPRWVDDRLLLVDLLSGRLLEADGDQPGLLRPVLQVDVALGAVAPVAGAQDSWIAAVGTGIARVSANGDLEWLDKPADGGHPRRMNDAACDPEGRFWAGCMAWDSSPGAGALFRTDADGTVTQVLDGLTIPNGPAFTADGALMYLADSGRGVVEAFPVDRESGDLGAASPFVEFESGSPDGLAIDVDGNVWVAVWGIGEVHQYSPDGSLRGRVRVPARQPTAPCLGGPEGRRLFITSATYGLAAEERGLSGSVFAVDVDVPGIAATAYRPA